MAGLRRLAGARIVARLVAATALLFGVVAWPSTAYADPPVTLFAADAVPAVTALDDPVSVEVGVRFESAASGSLTGLRFYQGPGNTGTHTGSLWSAGGTLLASLTFPAPASDGWQTANFSSPVPIVANTTYVASYFAPDGHYAANANFFNATFTNGPLSAPAGGNGVFHYGATSAFPSEPSPNATNYWVDPIFTPGNAAAPSTFSIVSTADAPAVANWPEPQANEVGVRFTSDADGTVTAVRFYKGSQNTGTHTGSLWAANGTLLATGTFTNETASGWQTLTFDQPVAITAGTAYLASYHTEVGFYSANIGFFAASGLRSGPLHVAINAGAFIPGATAFPDQTSSTYYWVDVVFKPKPKPATTPSPTAAASATQSGGNAGLPVTGSDVALIVGVGIALVGVGAVLVVRGRRRTV
jgi:LPXTG-motif cell wall-anchored protein